MEKNNYIPKTYNLENIPLVGIESELSVPFANWLRRKIKDVKRQAGWYHKSDTKLMLDDLLPKTGDSIVFPNGDTLKRNKTGVYYNSRLFNSIRAEEALKIIHEAFNLQGRPFHISDSFYLLPENAIIGMNNAKVFHDDAYALSVLVKKIGLSYERGAYKPYTEDEKNNVISKIARAFHEYTADKMVREGKVVDGFVVPYESLSSENMLLYNTIASGFVNLCQNNFLKIVDCEKKTENCENFIKYKNTNKNAILKTLSFVIFSLTIIAVLYIIVVIAFELKKPI